MEQRETLIKLLSEHHSGNYDEAQRIADYLLANGVVVLPCRCKECVHARKLNANFGVWEYSCIYFNTHATTGNDFCSRGKRKGGDE